MKSFNSIYLLSNYLLKQENWLLFIKNEDFLFKAKIVRNFIH